MLDKRLDPIGNRKLRASVEVPGMRYTHLRGLRHAEGRARGRVRHGQVARMCTKPSRTETFGNFEWKFSTRRSARHSSQATYCKAASS